MKTFALAIALALASPAAPLLAQTAPAAAEKVSVSPLLQSAAAGVVAVLKGERPPAEVFAQSFLDAVPEAQLKALNTQLVAQLGPLQGVEKIEPAAADRAKITLRFGRALVGGPMVLAPDGKVTGLVLNDVQPLGGGGIEGILAELESWPGEVSVLYAPLDPAQDPILAHNPDTQLAIGSAFKLYVLSTLAQQVKRGVRSWDEVVRLDTRSYPSGILHDWPNGAPVTLHTLAALMISISDNTATDQLIHLLGRAAVNEEVVASGHSRPAGILPFLTTLEAFGYKADPTRAASYASAAEDRQAVLLEAFAQEIAGDPAKVAPPTFTKPTMIDSIEWLASANDIRRVMARLATLDDPTAREILAISPSIPEPNRKDWAYVGFKGGSEPGVLNLSWLLQAPDGEWRVMTMSWNNPQAPVDTSRMELLAQRLLALPRS